MSLTDSQVRQLNAKLEAKFVRTREANGAKLYYVEGWHVIAEANRIFGYDAWDRRTIASTCVWSGTSGAYHTAAYTVRVRVSVRAGDILIVREGSGTGEGRGPTPGQAHELALKSAETDATKRAFSTFGNPFGLALYDREQSGVRRPRGSAPSSDKAQAGPWVLRSTDGTFLATHQKTQDFVEMLRQVMSEAKDIELLYDIWEHNIETLRAVHRCSKNAVIPGLVGHLRACAVALVKSAHGSRVLATPHLAPDTPQAVRQKIDKSTLAISEPKRIRSKEHLRFVASQPCLICGRTPSHAHHLRHAQSRGLSLKVSDEFTVPLCAVHHNHIHATLKEAEWWQERKVDSIKVAEDLWQRSRKRATDNEVEGILVETPDHSKETS